MAYMTGVRDGEIGDSGLKRNANILRSCKQEGCTCKS